VATSLPYLHRALLACGHPDGLEVTILDDDTVSHTSGRLQPYRLSDLGEFKCVVVVERLNVFWDLNWRAVTNRLCDSEQLEGVDIVIGCAPTSRARAAIAGCAAGASKVHYWLDLASTARGSQFVLGEPQNLRNDRSRTRLPVVSELFPEIIDDRFDAEESASGDSGDRFEGQEAFVSQILANHALMLMTRLFVYGTVSYHGGFLDRRGGVRPLRIVPHGSPLGDSRGVDE